MPLSKAFGLKRGWPIGPGQYVAPVGSVPTGAIFASYSTGYVRNDSGGYVLRSFT